MSEYTLEFCMLAAGSVWNDLALKVVFRQDLDSNVLTELACLDEQHTLESY